MLVALGRDPLYLSTADAAALRGLVRTIDAGLAAAPRLEAPRLVLVGARDQVVPDRAFTAFIQDLVADDCTVVRYPEGWHLLLRDLGRDVVIADILAWLDRAPLPSGHGRACPGAAS